MHLSPADNEKLLLAVAGMVARDRLDRGMRLNYPETVALLSTWVIERAREGHSVAELMIAGRGLLAARCWRASRCCPTSPRCCTTSRSRPPFPTAASSSPSISRSR